MRNPFARMMIGSVLAYTLLVGLTPTFALAPTAGEATDERPVEAPVSESIEIRIEREDDAGTFRQPRKNISPVGNERSTVALVGSRVGTDHGSETTGSWVREASARMMADYETSQSTRSWWKNASKTQRIWTVVAAVVVVGVSAAALSED